MPDLVTPDASTLARDGYAMLASTPQRRALSIAVAKEFEAMVGAGTRHLLESDRVSALLRDLDLRSAVQQVLGAAAFAYKATLFDKHTDANWLVAWHQDISIPVVGHIHVDGWQSWTRKDGVQYVQPPEAVLSQLLAVRVHLDPSREDNGPLCVLAGSHRRGRLQQAEISAAKSRFPMRSITGEVGTAVLMRPLLIHSSTKSTSTVRRRVLHLEFAASELPGGLEWHRRVSL
ncbi:MAG: phytanoyl-CoA dioxygenase family protein [Usitatibacteraceae bacterium]